MIRILRTSSREKEDLLPGRLDWFKANGMEVRYDDLTPDPQWAYAAAPASDRAKALTNALAETGTKAILCARGGYGASDILHLLPWDRIKKLPEKMLVGFSDVSALHAAFYTLCGWRGIHGPMPATQLWNKDGETRDIGSLLELIDGNKVGGSMGLAPVGSAIAGNVSGVLFGGCYSVLTNLIGTPYLPRSLKGHILFFEDLDEHPARLMRHWNQWLQSGLLDGVKAVVIGNLLKLGQNIPDNAPFVVTEWAKRCPVPLFKSEAFGHLSPNFPLGFGSLADITCNLDTSKSSKPNWSLKWNFKKDLQSIS